MTTDDALWWQTFWIAASAIATFVVGGIALFVGLLPGWKAAEVDRAARVRSAGFVFAICNPAVTAIREAAVVSDELMPSSEKIKSGIEAIGKAQLELARFDFVWKTMTVQQAQHLLSIEQQLQLVRDDFEHFVKPGADVRTFGLTIDWHERVSENASVLSARLDMIVAQAVT